MVKLENGLRVALSGLADAMRSVDAVAATSDILRVVRCHVTRLAQKKARSDGNVRETIEESP